MLTERAPILLVLALAAALAATLIEARLASAACSPTPACLEASFPASYSWGALSPGGAGNTSAEQTLTVTSNGTWGVRVNSDHADGRMREWTGTSYAAGGKVLSNALTWALTRTGDLAQAPSFQALSGTPATVVTSQPSTCTDTCASTQIGVTYRQAVSFSDPPAGGNDYRILITYEAAQGF